MTPGERLRIAAERLVRVSGGLFVYRRGGATLTVPARLGILTTTQRYQWFTASETSNWAAPAYVLMVAGDFLPFGGEPTTADSVLLANFEGAGTPYEVKRWDKPRIGGVAVKTVLFLEKR
ncbi:MAG: hypothetical protein SFU56_05315 [Capsulimonadales bacterium]|nr:hypothetical protein [Capsulimonadales bacterium]